jgi:23S rRNA pseudouridine2605 synthase
MLVRVHKILADSGITSRRKAEELIKDGRVTVNNAVITMPGSKADPEQDKIRVDNKLIPNISSKVYLVLNKPAGCVTTLSDPEGRPTVADLISGISTRLYPVGRLDYDTEGLLVLTNDGEISHLLQHPSNNISRTYLVKVKSFPEDAALKKLTKTFYRNKHKAEKIKLKLHRKVSQNTWFELTIWEGRNRQIKRMFEAIGHPVLRIIRIGLGPLTLDTDLLPGKYRHLGKEEVKILKSLVVQRR